MAGALVRLLVGDGAPVFEFEFRPRSGKVRLGLPIDLVQRAFHAFSTWATAVMTEEMTDIAMITVLIFSHRADVRCLLGSRLHLPFDCRIERTAARMCEIEIEVAVRLYSRQGKKVQMKVVLVNVHDDSDET